MKCLPATLESFLHMIPGGRGGSDSEMQEHHDSLFAIVEPENDHEPEHREELVSGEIRREEWGMDMDVREFCHRVLNEGLGSLERLPNFREIVEGFLYAVLGPSCMNYVWWKRRCGNSWQESPASAKVDGNIGASSLDPEDAPSEMIESPNVSMELGEEKGQGAQALFEEPVMQEAYKCLMDKCLHPMKRAAIIRRAERRVVKNQLAYARKSTGGKASVRHRSRQEHPGQINLIKAFEAGLTTAEQILAYRESLEAEKNALAEGLQVFSEIISGAHSVDEFVIEEAVRSALDLGLETLNCLEGQVKADVQDAVAIKLEKAWDKAGKTLRKSLRQDIPIPRAIDEILEHFGQAARWGEQSLDTLEVVMEAVRTGAERVLKKDGHGPGIENHEVLTTFFTQ